VAGARRGRGGHPSRPDPNVVLAPRLGEHLGAGRPVVTWAVIATRDRHRELADLLEDLDQARAVVVDNGSDPPVRAGVAEVVRDNEQPPNLSRLWNLGLDAAARHVPPDTAYEVAVLNDDLRIPAGTLDTLADAMRCRGGAAAFPDQHGLLRAGDVDVLRKAEPHNLFHRMTGYCFLLAGELGLRADERFRWWYGDDDLEWRAALAGGVVRVGGAAVNHLHPNGSTASSPELSAQAGLDRAAFVAKWGRPPW
jgi:GT2 family glycosyltransferase